jgi:hypothetical protein
MNVNKEVTLFITSCGRPELLKRTLQSFVKFNTYPIKEVILCEDSGIHDIADFVKSILPFPITFCYNKERIGQMKTIEKYTPLIKTDYVFHLEDDYEFFDSGFIELSFQIMDSDPKISQVLLEDEQHTFAKIDIGNPLCYKVMTYDPNICDYKVIDGPLTIFTWRPSLKRLDIQKLRMPYEPWDDEYTIQLLVNKLGYYSVITKNEKDGKKGFCTHIGKAYHIEENYQKIYILSRKDFPDKINISLKDI